MMHVRPRLLTRQLSTKPTVPSSLPINDLPFDELCEILPDGLVTVKPFLLIGSLNKTIGSGKWLLRPTSSPFMFSSSSSSSSSPLLSFPLQVQSGRREFELVVGGEVVACAEEGPRGGLEGPVVGDCPRYGAALVACVRRLGLLAALDDEEAVRAWVARVAAPVMAENVVTAEVRRYWKRTADPLPYPWREAQQKPVKTKPEIQVQPGPAPGYEPAIDLQPTAHGPEAPPPSSSEFQPGLFDPPIPSSSSSSSSSLASFDPNAKVPSQFKKIAGKTWLEVLMEPSGRSYLHWASEKFTGDLQETCKQALAYARQVGLYGKAK